MLKQFKFSYINNFTKSIINRRILPRLFHEDFSSSKPLDQQHEKKLTGAVKTKFEIFKDEDSNIIYDVEEEKQRLEQQQYQHDTEDEYKEFDKYYGISKERGHYGVFDIEDLVEILRKENAINIFVCSVPKNIKYVDYMCIVTGRSYRHMSAIVEFVKRIYKMKRNNDDIVPKIEGEKSRDWMAIDLGNIALHVFSSEARKIYDLESLWSIGPEYDAEYNKPKDPLIELFEKNSIYLNDLKPKQMHKE